MNDAAPLALTAGENQRLADVRRLKHSGAAAVEALLSMLGDASWAVRRAVVAALAELGAESAPRLCETLRLQRDSETRIAAAVDALVQNGADVVSELAGLAGDANPAVAADAAQILGRRAQARGVPILTALVSHEDDNVAVAAIEALGRIGGPSAVESLISAARSGNFFRVFPAIDVLGRSGDPRAIAPLALLLQNPMYLLEAARALGKTGQAAAVPPLAGLLLQPSEGALRVAAVALAELHARHRERYGSDETPAETLRGTGAGAAVPRLLRCLSNADPQERGAIALVLGVLGGDGAAEALSSLLEPADAPLASAAAAALARLGTDSDEQVRHSLHSGSSARRRVLLPIIVRSSSAAEVAQCLTDADPEVRISACDALARTGAVAHIPELFQRLADGNVRVVQAAVAAIQALGSAEARALALRAAAASEPSVQRSALRILGYFGVAEALPVLLQALEVPDSRLHDLALSGLAYLEQPEAFDALLSAARSPREPLRRSGMRALGQVARSDARLYSTLRAGLDDADAWVRYYACQSAGKLRLKNATAAIVKLLADEAGQVRVSAVEALSQLQTDEALQALCQMADAADPDLRRAALIGLGIAGRPEGVTPLLRATQSEDAATRLVAISALAESGAPQRIAALERAVGDVDENVRAAALGFLSSDPDPGATRVLFEQLTRATDPSACIAWLSRPSPGRVAGLLAMLPRAELEDANLCCSLLARVGSSDAVAALLRTLDQGEPIARRAAAPALASLRTPEASAAVRHAAAFDVDPRVRQICSILSGQ